MTLTQAEGRKIARPLKTLIPMIQSELQQGNDAGREHYRRAGQMLNEARDQIPRGGWTKWLTKNFDLSPRTAGTYMQWARLEDENRRGAPMPYHSLREMRGDTDRAREERKQQRDFRRVFNDIARDDFVQERQTREAEIDAYRKMAMKFVEAGYYAMSMKLHPDRGGSKEEMIMLNRIREVFRSIAEQRRFV